MGEFVRAHPHLPERRGGSATQGTLDTVKLGDEIACGGSSKAPIGLDLGLFDRGEVNTSTIAPAPLSSLERNHVCHFTRFLVPRGASSHSDWVNYWRG